MDVTDRYNDSFDQVDPAVAQAAAEAEDFRWNDGAEPSPRPDPNLTGTAPVPAALRGVSERVSFSAPVSVRPEGEEHTYHGLVMNLSSEGMAALAPVDLQPGQRAWTSFRLGLAEEPMQFLTEVIWSRPTPDDQFGLGLRFRSMTQEEADRVRTAVTERAEGRAGEWPLPIMPSENENAAPDRSSRRPAAWISVAGGIAAGIVLALVASLFSGSSHAESEDQRSPPAYVGGAASAAEARSADPISNDQEPVIDFGAMELASADLIARAEGKLAQASPKPDAQVPVPAKAEAPKPRGEPTSRAVGSAPTVRVADEKPRVRTRTLPRKTTERPRKRNARNKGAAVLRPTGTTDALSLALLTDGPVGEHTEFWLSNPRRLVVDVMGRRSGFSKQDYAVEHPLASRLRVGHHPDKVRFVLETTEDVEPQATASPRGTALVVTVRKL